VDPQDPKGVAREAARDLTGIIVGKLAALKAAASRWLAGPEYDARRLRLWRTRTRLPRRRWWRLVGG
jgi:hypothetical protein